MQRKDKGMNGNERVAVLEQRVKQLEADEERQRNWKMRYLGWLISPSIALFVAGLTMWGQIIQLQTEIENLKTKVENIGNELGNIHDKIEAHDH